MNGKQLKQLFEQLGLTKAKLYRATGVSRETIQRVFDCDPRVKDSTRVALEVALQRFARERQAVQPESA